MAVCFRKFIPIVFAGLMLTLCLPSLSYAETFTKSSEHTEGRTLVIGKVSTNPKKHYRYLKPIADYAVSKMTDLGYQDSKVLMARNNDEMVQLLKSGRVDWVTETPFSAMYLKNESGAELLVRKWKKRVPEYHTVFFARKDSDISSLDDLQGKTIAFQDDGSTSAYYIPAYLLIKNGNQLVKLASPKNTPDKSNTGYVFAREEINMSTWVHKGIVDAAAFSNMDWEKDDNTPEVFRDDLTIFHKSRPYPRAIELVRGDLNPEVKKRLQAILLKIDSDPQAQEVLTAYQKTKKFDLITPEISNALNDTESILNLVNRTLDK